MEKKVTKVTRVTRVTKVMFVIDIINEKNKNLIPIPRVLIHILLIWFVHLWKDNFYLL